MWKLPPARTLLVFTLAASVAGAALSATAGASAVAVRERALPRTLTPQTVQFTSSPPTDAVVGGPTYTPTAAANPSGESVSFAVDPATTNGACVLEAGVVAFVNAGSCVIDADVPGTGGSTGYGPAQAQQTIPVAQAGTTAVLTVGPASLAAQVTATAPSDGTPSGEVVFSVEGRLLGSVALSAGVATLAYTVPADTTETITATYAGSAGYAGSSASQTVTGPTVEDAFVTKPTIRAVLSSRAHRNRRGWWHTVLTVRFVCNRAGSVIVGGCPKPVVLRHSVRDATLTRRIRTTAGTGASVTVRHIRMDLGAPRVRVAGVRRGGHYRAVARARCVASDRVSGIVSCRLRVHVRRGAAVEKITYTATAVSGAGVVRSASVTAYVAG